MPNTQWLRTGVPTKQQSQPRRFPMTVLCRCIPSHIWLDPPTANDGSSSSGAGVLGGRHVAHQRCRCDTLRRSRPVRPCPCALPWCQPLGRPCAAGCRAAPDGRVSRGVHRGPCHVDALATCACPRRCCDKGAQSCHPQHHV